MGKYDIRIWQEAGWAVLVAVVVEGAMILSGLHPEAIQDWRAWAIVAAGALARAAGIAVAAIFGKATFAR